MIRPAHVEAIRLRLKTETRRELRRILCQHHGLRLPPGANLRAYVPLFHAEQGAINAGHPPSPFWRRAVGLPNVRG